MRLRELAKKAAKELWLDAEQEALFIDAFIEGWRAAGGEG